MIEGSGYGSVQIMTDSDPEGPKTYTGISGSRNTTSSTVTLNWTLARIVLHGHGHASRSKSLTFLGTVQEIPSLLRLSAELLPWTFDTNSGQPSSPSPWHLYWAWSLKARPCPWHLEYPWHCHGDVCGPHLRHGHGESVPVRDQNGMVEAGLVEVGEGQLTAWHLHHDVISWWEEPLAQLLDE